MDEVRVSVRVSVRLRVTVGLEDRANSCLNVGPGDMAIRERRVQPKLDRSDSVLFSRVRPAIQYRSSTEWGEAVSGYM